jgi:pilus assembly protein CpaC
VVVKLIFQFFALTFFTIVTVHAQTAPVAQDSTETEVVVGIDKVERLDFKPSTKVEVGNESILTYTLIPDDSIREIIFKGLKPGKTSVILRSTTGEIKRRYRISVTSNDLSKTVIRLREFFDDLEGIEVKIKGGSVVVEGQIVVPADIGKVKVILEREEFKDVMSLVELSPQTQVMVAKRMQDEIQKSGVKNVNVRVVNKQYWLEGFVTKKGDREQAESIARSLLPDKLENLARTTNAVATLETDPVKNFVSENIKNPPEPLPKMIKIITQFVALSKEYNKTFGFKWTPALSGDGGSIQFGKTSDGGVTTRSSGTLSGTISNLFPKLASAKSAGNARIIQQGMVVVKDNTQAQVNKTSSQPFALGTGEFTRAQTSEAGFTLTIRPTIRQDENVELAANLSVSVQTGSPPEKFSNSVNTTLMIKSLESAAIGGVTTNESNTGYDKDPPFGEDQFEDATPVFSFIKSKAFTNNKSQFVVFVTPEIIDSASTGTDEIKTKFKQRRR